MEQTMICEVCGMAKPASDFSKSYKHRCKKCVAEDTRKQREAKKLNKHIEAILFSPTVEAQMWEQRRYEIAARMFPDTLTKQREICQLANSDKMWNELPHNAAAQAVELADALIAELKKEKQ